MNRHFAVFPILLSLFTFVHASRFDVSESLAVYDPVLSDEYIRLLRNADVDAGAAYFERKCAQCHDHDKQGGHSKGPHLWNVMGRTAGTIAGFEFSDAMKQSGHTWGFATLDYYLTRTDRAVPGRLMNFRGIKKDVERANLLAFIRTLSDSPAPLP